MITRIEAHNYRCFARLAVDLDRYHVLAGANGAGKTTLLDIPVLIGDMLRRQRAVEAFLESPADGRPPRTGTLTSLLHQELGDSVAFAVEASLPPEVVETLAETSQPELNRPVPTHLRYELRLEVTPRTLRIADEYLFLFSSESVSTEHRFQPGVTVQGRPEPGVFPQGRPERGTELGHPDWQPVLVREGGSLTRFLAETETRDTAPASRPRSRSRATPKQPARMQAEPVVLPPDIRPIQVSTDQLALAALPPDRTLFAASVDFLETLRGDVVFYDPSWDALRRPAPPGDPQRLIPSGRNLPWLALELQESDPEEFAAWEANVRTALPQVIGVNAIEREEDHYAYISVGYQGGYRVTSSGLSDGTLRILALSILPYLPDEMLPRLLVTEEPENGIHPRAIETVVQSLSMLYGPQVWISTHSPIVLAQTNLPCVLAARLAKDGSVSVVPGDKHPRLQGLARDDRHRHSLRRRGAQLTCTRR